MRQALFSGLAAALSACAFSTIATVGAQPSPATQNGLALSRSVLASELIGMRVRTPTGERVGAIEDLVVSSGNSVSAAVVSVGGFFGLGAKRVEVPFDRLQLDRDASIVVSMSREDLVAMPAYATESYAIVPPPAADRASAAAAAPPTPQPDLEATSEANAESARSFATDDPRVAKGIAENKEAFDGDGVSGEAEPK
jgi:sporulation protein YlmC with PRC-barrel domain